MLCLILGLSPSLLLVWPALSVVSSLFLHTCTLQFQPYLACLAFSGFNHLAISSHPQFVVLGNLKVWDNKDVKFFCLFLHYLNWPKANVYSMWNLILSGLYEEKEKTVFIRSSASVSTVNTGLDELIKFCTHQPPTADGCARDVIMHSANISLKSRPLCSRFDMLRFLVDNKIWMISIMTKEHITTEIKCKLNVRYPVNFVLFRWRKDQFLCLVFATPFEFKNLPLFVVL